jgi:cytochrome oxidase Cu insertion factor (SCO1/SenC/PrrC family)
MRVGAVLRLSLAAVGALALLAVSAPGAWADGDPASDVLLSQAMFVPADANATSDEQARLASLLHRAADAGFPIRVAVISSGYDLGSVTTLWRRPQTYARFLGIELGSVYKGALLVVMPNGYGVNLPGHSTARAYRRLSHLARRPAGGDPLAGTDAAVVALAATANPALGALRTNVRGGGVPLAALGAAIAALLIVLAAATLLRRAGTDLGSAARTIASRALGAIPVPRTRLAVLNVGLGLAVAASASVLGLGIADRTARSPADAQAAEVAPFTFRAGQHAAPPIGLVDQNGRPVSLAAFHGKPVIVTFIDPLCRNLCPLAAHVLNALDRELPPAQRIPIIAVSVDVYADSRADLLEDYTRWRLVPQWHWAVGPPAVLASVWHRYGVQVAVQTKHIAGTTVHFISHYEVAFVVDPRRYLRDLFFWPYTPSSVEQALRKASQT